MNFQRFYRSLAVFLLLFLLTLPANSRALELKKEQLIGKIWNKRKYYFVFKEDGSYIKELRISARMKPIFTCNGTYTIEGDMVSLEGICPENKDKLKLRITKISDDRFVADQYSFGAQLPPDGALSKDITYKAFKKKSKKKRKKWRRKRKKRD